MVRSARLFTIFIFLPLFCFSQNINWEIVLLNNQSYKNVMMQNLENDTLHLQFNDALYKLPVDSIKYIKQKGNSGVNSGTGFLIGAIAGGITSNLYVRNNYNTSGMFKDLSKEASILITTGAGILVGSVLGMIAGSERLYRKTYELYKYNHNVKKSIINKLIEKSKKYQNEQLK